MRSIVISQGYRTGEGRTEEHFHPPRVSGRGLQSWMAKKWRMFEDTTEYLSEDRHDRHFCASLIASEEEDNLPRVIFCLEEKGVFSEVEGEDLVEEWDVEKKSLGLLQLVVTDVLVG